MISQKELSISNSLKLHKRAKKVLPGGVNASARLNPTIEQAIFMEKAEGAYVYDVDKNKYIDFWNSHGATFLGHGHPAIVKAVNEILEIGILCAAETDLQVEVAENLVDMFPGMEMVRYSGSGTETTWHALRIARAYTGKLGVAKFEGHFHGVNDTVGFSCWPPLEKAGTAKNPLSVPESGGIPVSNSELVTVLPFNDIETLETTLRLNANKLGALIMEPVNYNSCGITPTSDFLSAVRTLTRDLGIVLIFDEILSGFRINLGSAVSNTNIIPDMTILGKALGGGMPISAFMGTREIMETCIPNGPVVHSGTYNAHLVGIAAVKAFLEEVSRPNFYENINTIGEHLYSSMCEIFNRRNLKAWVQGKGSRFGLLFGVDSEPLNYRDTLRQDMDMMSAFNIACLKRGLYMLHWSPHHGYSSAHSMKDIEESLDIIDQASKEVSSNT